MAVLWVAVAALALWRLDRWAHRWLDLRFPASERDSGDTVVIPDDLDGLALLESETHAQDSVREAIRERYEQYHDWNKVRTAMGIGTIDGAE